jgi:hypothetical protein
VHCTVHSFVYLQLSKWNICFVLLCNDFVRHQWQSTVYQALVLQYDNRPQTLLLCHTNFKCWVKSRLITPVPWFNKCPCRNKICQWLNISTNKYCKSLVISTGKNLSHMCKINLSWCKIWRLNSPPLVHLLYTSSIWVAIQSVCSSPHCGEHYLTSEACKGLLFLPCWFGSTVLKDHNAPFPTHNAFLPTSDKLGASWFLHIIHLNDVTKIETTDRLYGKCAGYIPLCLQAVTLAAWIKTSLHALWS